MNILIVARIGLVASAALSLSAEELPGPWKHQDLGTAQVGKMASVAGSAKHAAGAFTIQGTMDIWGPADGFHYVWQPVQGDVVLVARVTAMDNPGKVGHAKAGLCLRESIEGGARCVTLCVTPGDGSQFTYREKAGGPTVRFVADPGAPKAGVAKGAFPCWLKLVRRGSEVSGYESADGETWSPTGHIKLDLTPDAVIGLTSSSHTKDTLTTSTFDRVNLSKPVAGAGEKK
jgi:hypothetical protein